MSRSNVPLKYTSHVSKKDLAYRKTYISPYQRAQARYRARQLGSPVLPKDKQELKELIDKALTDYYQS